MLLSLAAFALAPSHRSSSRDEVPLSQSVALERVARTTFNVRRLFYVGRDLNRGYYLVPPTALRTQVMPDILDGRILAAFDRESGQQSLASHIGQKLICECDGVAWFYHKPRFLVRGARLIWSR